VNKSKDYMKGAGQFPDTIPTASIAPMHFGEAYDKAAALSGHASAKKSKVIR
jgi:hypothetical protein